MELWIYAKGVADLLHRLGLSWTRPTYTLKSGFQETTGIFGRNLPEPKKLLNSDIDHLLFEDETMIRDYQAIGCTWFLRGHQRKIPTYGQHKGVKLIGTLIMKPVGSFVQKKGHTTQRPSSVSGADVAGIPHRKNRDGIG